MDVNLKGACIVELNTINSAGSKVIDSSGSGNIVSTATIQILSDDTFL